MGRPGDQLCTHSLNIDYIQYIYNYVCHVCMIFANDGIRYIVGIVSGLIGGGDSMNWISKKKFFFVITSLSLRMAQKWAETCKRINY